MSALTADRQPSSVPQAPIASDIHQSLDVHLDLLTEIALHHSLLVDDRTDAVDLFLSQLANPLVDVNARFFEYPISSRTPYTIYVSETYLCSLICRQVHTRYSCH